MGLSWFKFNILGLRLGMALRFYTSVGKGVKLKVKEFLGLASACVEVTREKLVEGPSCPSIILNLVNFQIFKAVTFLFLIDAKMSSSVSWMNSSLKVLLFSI